MKLIRVLIALLAMTASAYAATTTLSGSVVDSDSVEWIGGTYMLTFVYNPSLGTPVVNGQAFTLSFTGTLDGTGSFSQAVTSTTGTTPVTNPPASGWMVTVCPAFLSSPCYSTAPLAVTGASQSVTTQISAVIKAPRITAIGIPQAYADVEVPEAPGNQYFRVTDNTFRCYTTSWGACGGSSGGGSVGTAGQLQMVGSTAGSFAASGLTDNGSAIVAIRSFAGPRFVGTQADAVLLTGNSANTDTAGELTLSSGTATYNFVGAYGLRPECFIHDHTAPASLTPPTFVVTNTSIVIAGTGSDIVGYGCIYRQ